MTSRDFDPASLAAGLVVMRARRPAAARPGRRDRPAVRLLPARHPRHGRRDHAGRRAHRPATLSGPENMADMSAAGHQASQPPLRRDREGAVVGGVCAGLGRRLGIDPIILRVVFIAATAAGGLGIALYLLAWVAMPAEGERRAGGLRVPALPGGPRLVDGGGRHRAARARAAAGVPPVGPVDRRRAGLAGRAGGRRRRADLAPVRQRRRPGARPRGSPPAPAAGARSAAPRSASPWSSAPRCSSSTSTTR